MAGLFLVGLTVSGGRVLSGSDQEPRGVELEDQFGQRHPLLHSMATPMILIGGDRESRSHSQAWAVAVRDLLSTNKSLAANVEIVRVADLRAVPSLLRGRVTKQLRRSVETPLLMDWQGQITGRYEFRPQVANVVLVDRDGSVAWRVESDGTRSPEIDGLEQALREMGQLPSTEVGTLLQPNLLGSCL